MRLIKNLSSSLIGITIGYIIIYFVFGERSIDWMFVGFLVGFNVIVLLLTTLLTNGKLGKKVKSKNK